MGRKGLFILLTWVLALVLCGSPALAVTPAVRFNMPIGTKVTIHYQGEDIVGELGSAEVDEERGQLAVCFASNGLSEHIKLDQNSENFSIIVPVMAAIVLDSEIVKPVDGTFFKDEAWWFFATKEQPDAVIFYAHGGEPTDPDAVTIDVKPRSLGADLPVDESGSATAPQQAEAPASPDTPAPAVATEPSDADHIDQLLFELARDAEDPWVKAILQAGCGGFDPVTETAVLRSFNPKLSDLPGYDKDPAGWLAAFKENIVAFELSVPVELEGDVLSESGEKALLAAVKKAAGTAKSAFDQKQVRVAIADWLLPRPLATLKSASDLADVNAFSERFLDLVSEDLFESGEQKWYAPLLYAQSKQSLSVKGGPHQLVLTARGADPAALSESAKASALSKLSKQSVDDRDDIEGALLDALVSQAMSLRSGGGSEQKFVLDIDTLFDGEYGDEYAEYIGSYRPESIRDAMQDAANALPDYPSQDFPKTGRISGSKSGTQINIKAPKDELGRYVQMRDADTGEMSVDMFIRPGQTCTVRVPKGMYYLTVASGSTWYGIDGLFGPTGRLSKTEDMEVMSSKYYHDITLQVSDGGNMNTYGASASDFAR